MDIEDYSLDYYLEQVEPQTENQEPLEEIEDVILLGAGAVALGVGTIYNIGKVVSFIMSAAAFHRSIKVDPIRSKRVNKILNSGNTWIVHQFPDPVPNAFAITGKHVFITTGLVNILNEREQDGVLLHEVWHNKDLHMWKKIATESALTYLIIFVSVTSTLTIFPGLGILVAFLMKNIFSIAYARIMGRRHEYAADEYAVQYGYGKDLISAFEKMEKWAKTKSSNQPCGTVCKLERTISRAIDEHPPTKKRVETILRKTAELNALLKSGSYKKIAAFVVGVFKNNG